MIESKEDILLQPISILNGVGKVSEQRLNKIGIYVIRDLFFHFPIKYLDRTRITPLTNVRPADNVLIQGEITKSEIIYAKKRMLLVTIVDNDCYIKLRFFHFSESQKNSLSIGKKIRCFGEVRHGHYGYEIIHPQYSLDHSIEVEDNLTPIYPLSNGLNQKLLQNISKNALDMLNQSEVFSDNLPKEILQEYSLMPLNSALRVIHTPPPDISLKDLESQKHPAKFRLIFEELLAYQLALKKICKSRDKKSSLSISYNRDKSNKFIDSLSFSLTNAQERVIQEILQDLAKTVPMMRLLQGDVGCGKTIVAAFAALQVVCEKLQVAVMAPTEILAEQHCKNFANNFAGIDVNIAFLSSKLSKVTKQKEIDSIKSGQANIIIGTHALFQENVIFHKLGLVIIDEQHRFGVEQRLSLLDKSNDPNIVPHQLVMSATPIPRTMAMAIYADLDISIIDEMPKGRKEVQTVVIPNTKRDEVIDKISNILKQGKQAYWVCPLIDESEFIECQDAANIAEKLTHELSSFNIGLIHGKLKSIEKDEVIQKFKDKKIDLLVATTVIEVGVDIPNAGLIIIENAERLGLSQLHQLRGRVGRGSEESYCILMYQHPLSENSRKRLEIIKNSTDGFTIAKQDLELRGIGEIFGKNQTGLNNMKIANLARDHNLLDKISILANYLLDQDPINAQKIIDRWFNTRTDFIKA